MKDMEKKTSTIMMEGSCPERRVLTSWKFWGFIAGALFVAVCEAIEGHWLCVIWVFIATMYCFLADLFKEYSDDFRELSAERRRKSLNRSVIICVITSMICCFVPSSKTAMAIWGVGSVIDYVQENESLKELPDKCVKALEVWADSLNEEEKEEKEERK